MFHIIFHWITVNKYFFCFIIFFSSGGHPTVVWAANSDVILRKTSNLFVKIFQNVSFIKLARPGDERSHSWRTSWVYFKCYMRIVWLSDIGWELNEKYVSETKIAEHSVYVLDRIYFGGFITKEADTYYVMEISLNKICLMLLFSLLLQTLLLGCTKSWYFWKKTF